jgi:hypothetical protein
LPWPDAPLMPELFTCPECGAVTRDPALARLGYCAGCGEYTGRRGAGFIGCLLLATGAVSTGEWHWPCAEPGPERWRVAVQGGAAADIVLCTPHGDCLRSGGALWMRARGLRLTCLDGDQPALRDGHRA